MTDEPDRTQDTPTHPSPPAEPDRRPVGEPVVIRDKRRVRAGPAAGGSAGGSAGESAGGTQAGGPAGSGQPGGPSASGAPEEPAPAADASATDASAASGATATPAGDTAPGGAAEEPAVTAGPAGTAGPAEGSGAAETAGSAETAGPAESSAPAGGDGPSTATAPAAAEETAPALAAELEALRAEVEERTRDLQRVGAEYANYRKRVERDRERAGELAVAGVLSALLPVLDDFDRAREHEELPEGILAIADHLTTTLAKFGLSAFGEKGDPFDPNRHEAVAHQTSAEVTQPTCVEILRRGYLMGDRLLRPAMVAVADPE